MEEEKRKKTRVPAMQRGEHEEREKKQMQSSPMPGRGYRGWGQEGDEERSGEEGNTVVVGIRMDSQSKELLTWALVKVASPGDRVVALHVLPPAARESPDINSSSSLFSLVKAFDSVLAVYDGFCNLKQIELKMKICRGSSIRKVLVHEATSYGAAKLILGVNNNVYTMGSSSTSVAKYCAKKLSPECAVFAVNNGKAVFRTETYPPPRFSGTESEKATDATFVNAHIYQLTKKSNILISLLRRSPAVIKFSPGRCASAVDGDAKELGHFVSCFAMAKDKPLAIALVNKGEAPLSSPTVLSREISKVSLRQPPLPRASFSDNRTTHLEERPGASVVQWAMRLPRRYTAALAYQNGRRRIKSNAKVSSEPDEENISVAPVSAADNSTSSPSAVAEEEEVLEELKFLEEKYASVCRLFSYEELMHITGNFSPDNLVGKGGSSRVFKGHLEDGKELAIKVLNPSVDVMKAFVSEIEIITALHHKNIVSLAGFCFENNNFIIVYDFLSRGSLFNNLHGEQYNKSPLSWAERYKVALGVAEALDYLHGKDNAKPVIHRDVKSSNILLDETFNPKTLALRRGYQLRIPIDMQEFSWHIWVNSPLYLAPEYFMYGKINEKTDVYAFGVILLELVTGRKPVSTGCPKGEESLVMWAMSILQDKKVEQLVDPCLERDYDKDQLHWMILAASHCIKRAPCSRPNMPHILKLLRGDGEMLKWDTLQIGTQEEEGVDELDEEPTLRHPNNIQSHIDALLDLDDHSAAEPVDFLVANESLEEYMHGRWGRSSSLFLWGSRSSIHL